jgi:hypothetical protein
MNDIRAKVKGKTIENFRGFDGTHGVDRAKALAEWGMLDDALNVINTCLVLQSGMDIALFNRGVILANMGRYEEAIPDFNDVVMYQNTNKTPSAHKENAIYARGLCNLALGNLEDGFREYEPRRRHLTELPKRPHYTGAEDLKGKTLFVVGEPTCSENLLFSRFLSKVHCDIAFAVPPALQLMFHCFPGIRLVKHMDTIGYYDYWCTLMSLAVTSKATMETIPQIPKFALPLDNTIRWRPDMGIMQSRRVGLCWSGPECHDNGDMPLELMSPLFDLEGIEYFCFQDEVVVSDQPAFDRLDIWNMGKKFKNYIDAACALKSMDLLITVDNAIAHIAATLNIPCWVLLPKYKTHWLWASKKNVCPWYPSVRIFRQYKDGDWSTVITEVQKSLVEFCH